MPGCATSGGTAAYAVRMIGSPGSSAERAHGYTALGATGLTTSRLGFGGYRTTTEDPEHREALTKALLSGCNLVDTSTNYMDGDSERLVGSVLSQLVSKGALKRDEIIIVSKIGYVQGANLKAAEAREKAGNPYPEVVKYGDGIWHCLHPEFLDDQLALSLDRLGLQTLDVLLLHNAEYFLSDAKHKGQTDLLLLREEFYRRLQAAFAYLETQAAAGRLQYYGVSSNTCTAEPGDPEATSLSRMIETARHAAPGGAHHFRVLQLPMNLFESGALLTRNTGKDHGQTVLELVQQEQIAILVNRPLNAMPGKGNAMVRLADLPLEPKETDFDLQRDTIAKLEDEYRQTFAPHVQASAQGMPPQDYFRWASELSRIRPLIQNLEHWEQIEYQMIAPHINQVLRALTQHFTGDLAEKWQNWRDRYLPELLRLLRELRREATLKSREKTSALTRILDPLLPESRRHQSLSRKALWILTSTPGVTCVLNGMRTHAYVDDSLDVLGWSPAPHVQEIYKAVKEVRF